MPSGTLIRKMERQLEPKTSAWVRTPPRTGPRTLPTEMTVPYKPNALARALPEKVTCNDARTWGIITAAPAALHGA